MNQRRGNQNRPYRSGRGGARLPPPPPSPMPRSVPKQYGAPYVPARKQNQTDLHLSGGRVGRVRPHHRRVPHRLPVKVLAQKVNDMTRYEIRPKLRPRRKSRPAAQSPRDESDFRNHSSIRGRSRRNSASNVSGLPQANSRCISVSVITQGTVNPRIRACTSTRKGSGKIRYPRMNVIGVTNRTRDLAVRRR